MNTKNFKFNRYKHRAEQLLQDRGKLHDFLTNTTAKIRTIAVSNKKLKALVYRLNLMLRMIKAHYSGEYRDFPWKSTVLLLGSLLYFVTPIDMIPDFIPALGFTDDAALVYWVYQSVKDDIEKYRQWEISRQTE